MLPCFYAARALLGEADILQVSWEMVTKQMSHSLLLDLPRGEFQLCSFILFSYSVVITAHVKGYVKSVQTPSSGINRYQSPRS